MTCPYLTYRKEDDDHRFETDRAYCTVVGAFVQPMRADICNDRYTLDHEADCEFYRDHEGLDVESPTGNGPGAQPDGVEPDGVEPGGEDS